MLQRIRDRVTGWIAGIILVLLAVVFIFWGIDFQSGASAFALRVNGEKISLATVQQAWQDRLARLQQIAGGSLPAELLEAQQSALLDEYVREALLRQKAEDLGYRTSDAMLVETIRSFPELQVDGQFSRDRYAALLRQQGRTEPQFEAELRTSLAISQLRTGVMVSAFVTPAEIERRLALLGEEREIDYAIVPASTESVEVADAEIEAWYEANRARYVTPESVTLAYVDLTLDDVAQEVNVTDDALRAYYDQVEDRFMSPERRRARHVLIEAQDDDPAALAKAEDIAARARAGEDFAALAREHSQDPGSAEEGGDLGWATRGMFVGPFEEALFSIEEGEIAGPVKTQFGYHVIKLEEIAPGTVRSFEEVRDEIESEYRQEQAANLFYERSQLLADEAFANLDDLEPAARALGVAVETIEGFTREGGGALGSDREVIEAAFSEDVLERGENSALLQLGDDRVVVLRATDHRVPEQQPLEAVRERIATELRARKAREAAEERGRETLAQLDSDAVEWASALAELGVEPAGSRFVGREAADVPPGVLAAAFAAERPAPGDTTIYEGVSLPDGGYAIVRVSDVREGGTGPDAAAERAEVAQNASREAGMIEFAAYVNELERTADVDRNPAAFE